MKIIFMGTPAFAVPALMRLIASHHEVVCVYTQPPKPAGRGYKDTYSPIYQLAESHHLPLRTPARLKEPEIQADFKALEADIAVVAAYGLLLPQAILEACPLGCINIHPSLLPRWRGAAPIQRPIEAGDRETGIAIMQMDKGLDTGPVLALEKVPMLRGITAGELHDQLANQGAALLLETLDKLEKGQVTPTPQTEEGVTYAQKITKEEARIDWQQPATIIDQKIRAFTPWPGACFGYGGELFKVAEAAPVALSHTHAPGTLINDEGLVACKEGALQLRRVQRAGKKAMDIGTFLRGFPLPTGTVLEPR